MEDWVITNGDTTVQEYVQSVLYVLTPGTKASKNYKADMKKVTHEVNRGILGRNLEKEAGQDGISLLVA